MSQKYYFLFEVFIARINREDLSSLNLIFFDLGTLQESGFEIEIALSS